MRLVNYGAGEMSDKPCDVSHPAVPIAAMPYDSFISLVTRASCPICADQLSDDGCEGNAVYVDAQGKLWEFYRCPIPYPHRTVACAQHHHFVVVDGRLGTHLTDLDGLTRGWIVYLLRGD